MTALATAIGRGTNGARPAAGSPGRLYYDTTNSQLQRDNGSSWDSVEGAGGLSDQGVVTYLDFTTAAAPSSPASGKIRVYSKTGDHLAQKDSGGAETLLDATGGSSYTGVGSTERALVDPTGLSWSWTNQGSATITTTGKSLALHDPAGSSDAQRIRKKLVPSKPYTIYVHFIPSYIPKNTTSVSVGWFQSSDGHFTGFNQYFSGSAAMGVGKSATNYLFTADYIGSPPPVLDYWRWVRLTDAVGGNRTVAISRDGIDWIPFHSVATNDFITPDYVYFSVTSNNGSTFDASVIVDSWEEV